MTHSPGAGTSARSLRTEDVLAAITAGGPLSTRDIAQRLGGPPERALRSLLATLKDEGILEYVFCGWAHGGKVKQYKFALPVAREYARIGASEYRFISPSGTEPQSIRSAHD